MASSYLKEPLRFKREDSFSDWGTQSQMACNTQFHIEFPESMGASSKETGFLCFDMWPLTSQCGGGVAFIIPSLQAPTAEAPSTSSWLRLSCTGRVGAVGAQVEGRLKSHLNNQRGHCKA